ncbi:hypothetical protein TRAPUB_10237 [Trametes pubescens]|uniref:Acetyl-coenzyme A transporter 1 n=1 Tax=Trametes pubescens TaxID=154538 RepID=A0A1M2W044_TRAPU|nr:hypothetical protein TRAPUB_10237 [Trametes pubescens]
MSTSSTSKHKPRRRQTQKEKTPTKDSDSMPRSPRAHATSLETIEVLPRTPITSRTPRRGHAGWSADDDEHVEEVELSLLGEEDRRQAASDLTLEEEQAYLGQANEKRPFSSRDKRAIVLLIILYLIQGFPLGLALGSIPFILREHLSYSEIAVFSLAGYPYSLKLLWSPIVDSKFFPSIGRRKSWIIPMQLTIGSIMLTMAYHAEELMTNDKESTSEDISVKAVYGTMWQICKLRHVQTLVIVHLLAKIGWQANDAVTQLKMVEKGLGREDLAVTVLIDFPFQIVGGWLAGKWSRGDKPLRAWIYAFWPRLALTLLFTLMVYWFPTPPISAGFFVLLVTATIAQSFAGTIQFGGISAFHTRISDPVVGGTYMTLLNTFTNLGGTWPRFFVLKGVDFFSVATCEIKESGLSVKAHECVSEHGKLACSDLGGECVTEQDGYYIVSAICLGFGVLSVLFFLIPTARKLQVPGQRPE